MAAISELRYNLPQCFEGLLIRCIKVLSTRPISNVRRKSYRKRPFTPSWDVRIPDRPISLRFKVYISEMSVLMHVIHACGSKLFQQKRRTTMYYVMLFWLQECLLMYLRCVWCSNYIPGVSVRLEKCLLYPSQQKSITSVLWISDPMGFPTA